MVSFLKKIRYAIPLLGLFALGALFLKLPEVPDLFPIFHCKTCVSSDPYLPLIGSGYFALMIAIFFLFPAFPTRQIGRGGVTFAILLAVVLTVINLPGVCPLCLIAHLCNILIWIIWVIVPPLDPSEKIVTFKERLCLTLFSSISTIALFSCLNLTFMAYGFKISRGGSTSWRIGDVIPTFTENFFLKRDATHVVVNFISPDCPYCKEQLPILNDIVDNWHDQPCSFINVSPALLSELVEDAPSMEWIEDTEGSYRELFKVSGFPTMFVVKNDGKIVGMIPGVPEQLKERLMLILEKIN